MNQLSIANVINVSVAEVGAGLNEYNTSNLAIFSSEAFAGSFGVLGYKIYLEPSEVAVDFGSNSRTYALALKVFSQQPNILLPGGSLVVIPTEAGVELLGFSATPASGSFVINYNGDVTSAIPFSADAAQVQTAVRTLTGLEGATVTGSYAAGFTILLNGAYLPFAITTSANSLLTGGAVAVTINVTPTAAETIAEAISRASGFVQFFGVIGTEIYPDADIEDAADVIETLNKIAGFAQRDPDSLTPVTGIASIIKDKSQSKTRILFYGSDNDEDALEFVAAYFGRGLSVDFNGSNTTLTMHLKSLVGILPDPIIDQTMLTQAKTAGADVYVSIQGVPKVISSGENKFFDRVYNLGWFVGAIQVAEFNLLAQTATKIDQTEEGGVAQLSSADRLVCERARSNRYIAPGKWTSPTTFGNQAAMLENIEQRGYYIFRTPIALQSPADRSERKAPLAQIAIKEAGAIHSGNVIINVNE